MRSQRFFLFTGLAVLFMAGLAACDEEKRPLGDQLGVVADPDDPHFAYYSMVTDELTVGQPEWDGSQPLPRFIQELSNIVLESYHPSQSQPQTGWEVDCIQFQHVPANGMAGGDFPPLPRRNRWFCEFHLVAPNSGKFQWWQEATRVYIFLDGTIIKPQRAKSPPDAEWL